MIKVFVYGTLKQGHYNHKFLEGAEFIGEGTAERLFLSLAPGKMFPYAGRGIGTIQGELYEVTREQLDEIDYLESHPRYYKRERMEVTLNNCETETAWIYLYKHADRYPAIKSGVWEHGVGVGV